MEIEEIGGYNVTAWHVQKLYYGDEYQYYVLPYDLFQTVKDTMKMEDGMKQTIKFLVNSRLSENSAESLCEKKNLRKYKSEQR